MARPKKTDEQRRDVPRLIRLTKSEDVALIERAELAGMNISDFLREAGLKKRFTPRPPLAEAEFLLYLRGEIGRAGNNLNQLVQRLNAANLPPTAIAAQAVIDQMQEINTEVLNLLRHGYSGKKQG